MEKIIKAFKPECEKKEGLSYKNFVIFDGKVASICNSHFLAQFEHKSEPTAYHAKTGEIHKLGLIDDLFYVDGVKDKDRTGVIPNFEVVKPTDVEYYCPKSTNTKYQKDDKIKIRNHFVYGEQLNHVLKAAKRLGVEILNIRLSENILRAVVLEGMDKRGLKFYGLVMPFINDSGEFDHEI